MKNIKRKVINTTTFKSNFKDFKYEDEWKNAYFELLSWKNTWHTPLELDIISNVDHDAILLVIVKEADADRTREYLEFLGYGNIKETAGKTLELQLDCCDEEYEEYNRLSADWY